MLNRKLFDDGLQELIIAFNFDMTKTRADIWYKYSQDIEDHQWKRKIKNCIRNCRKVPTLADILDTKNWYTDNAPAEQGNIQREVDTYDYSKSSPPPELKDKLKSIGIKVNG